MLTERGGAPLPSSFSPPLPSLSSTLDMQICPRLHLRIATKERLLWIPAVSWYILGDLWAMCNYNQMSTTVHKHTWEHWFHSGHRTDFSNPASLDLSHKHLRVRGTPGCNGCRGLRISASGRCHTQAECLCLRLLGRLCWVL